VAENAHLAGAGCAQTPRSAAASPPIEPDVCRLRFAIEDGGLREALKRLGSAPGAQAQARLSPFSLLPEDAVFNECRARLEGRSQQVE
jgi:hypothetical protein